MSGSSPEKSGKFETFSPSENSRRSTPSPSFDDHFEDFDIEGFDKLLDELARDANAVKKGVCSRMNSSDRTKQQMQLPSISSPSSEIRHLPSPKKRNEIELRNERDVLRDTRLYLTERPQIMGAEKRTIGYITEDLRLAGYDSISPLPMKTSLISSIVGTMEVIPEESSSTLICALSEDVSSVSRDDLHAAVYRVPKSTSFETSFQPRSHPSSPELHSAYGGCATRGAYARARVEASDSDLCLSLSPPPTRDADSRRSTPSPPPPPPPVRCGSARPHTGRRGTLVLCRNAARSRPTTPADARSQASPARPARDDSAQHSRSLSVRSPTTRNSSWKNPTSSNPSSPVSAGSSESLRSLLSAWAGDSQHYATPLGSAPSLDSLCLRSPQLSPPVSLGSCDFPMPAGDEDPALARLLDRQVLPKLALSDESMHSHERLSPVQGESDLSRVSSWDTWPGSPPSPSPSRIAGDLGPNARSLCAKPSPLEEIESRRCRSVNSGGFPSLTVPGDVSPSKCVSPEGAESASSPWDSTLSECQPAGPVSSSDLVHFHVVKPPTPAGHDSENSQESTWDTVSERDEKPTRDTSPNDSGQNEGHEVPLAEITTEFVPVYASSWDSVSTDTGKSQTKPQQINEVLSPAQNTPSPETSEYIQSTGSSWEAVDSTEHELQECPKLPLRQSSWDDSSTENAADDLSKSGENSATMHSHRSRNSSAISHKSSRSHGSADQVKLSSQSRYGLLTSKSSKCNAPDLSGEFVTVVPSLNHNPDLITSLSECKIRERNGEIIPELISSSSASQNGQSYPTSANPGLLHQTAHQLVNFTEEVSKPCEELVSSSKVAIESQSSDEFLNTQTPRTQTSFIVIPEAVYSTHVSSNPATSIANSESSALDSIALPETNNSVTLSIPGISESELDRMAMQCPLPESVSNHSSLNSMPGFTQNIELQTSQCSVFEDSISTPLRASKKFHCHPSLQTSSPQNMHINESKEEEVITVVNADPTIMKQSDALKSDNIIPQMNLSVGTGENITSLPSFSVDNETLKTDESCITLQISVSENSEWQNLSSRTTSLDAKVSHISTSKSAPEQSAGNNKHSSAALSVEDICESGSSGDYLQKEGEISQIGTHQDEIFGSDKSYVTVTTFTVTQESDPLQGIGGNSIETIYELPQKTCNSETTPLSYVDGSEKYSVHIYDESFEASSCSRTPVNLASSGVANNILDSVASVPEEQSRADEPLSLNQDFTQQSESTISQKLLAYRNSDVMSMGASTSIIVADSNIGCIASHSEVLSDQIMSPSSKDILSPKSQEMKSDNLQPILDELCAIGYSRPPNPPSLITVEATICRSMGGAADEYSLEQSSCGSKYFAEVETLEQSQLEHDQVHNYKFSPNLSECAVLTDVASVAVTDTVVSPEHLQSAQEISDKYEDSEITTNKASHSKFSVPQSGVQEYVERTLSTIVGEYHDPVFNTTYNQTQSDDDPLLPNVHTFSEESEAEEIRNDINNGIFQESKPRHFVEVSKTEDCNPSNLKSDCASSYESLESSSLVSSTEMREGMLRFRSNEDLMSSPTPGANVSVYIRIFRADSPESPRVRIMECADDEGTNPDVSCKAICESDNFSGEMYSPQMNERAPSFRTDLERTIDSDQEACLRVHDGRASQSSVTMAVLQQAVPFKAGEDNENNNSQKTWEQYNEAVEFSKPLQPEASATRVYSRDFIKTTSSTGSLFSKPSRKNSWPSRPSVVIQNSPQSSDVESEPDDTVPPLPTSISSRRYDYLNKSMHALGTFREESASSAGSEGDAPHKNPPPSSSRGQYYLSTPSLTDSSQETSTSLDLEHMRQSPGPQTPKSPDVFSSSHSLAEIQEIPESEVPEISFPSPRAHSSTSRELFASMSPREREALLPGGIISPRNMAQSPNQTPTISRRSVDFMHLSISLENIEEMTNSDESHSKGHGGNSVRSASESSVISSKNKSFSADRSCNYRQNFAEDNICEIPTSSATKLVDDAPPHTSVTDSENNVLQVPCAQPMRADNSQIDISLQERAFQAPIRSSTFVIDDNETLKSAFTRSSQDTIPTNIFEECVPISLEPVSMPMSSSKKSRKNIGFVDSQQQSSVSENISISSKCINTSSETRSEYRGSRCSMLQFQDMTASAEGDFHLNSENKLKVPSVSENISESDNSSHFIPTHPQISDRMDVETFEYTQNEAPEASSLFVHSNELSSSNQILSNHHGSPLSTNECEGNVPKSSTLEASRSKETSGLTSSVPSNRNFRESPKLASASSQRNRNLQKSTSCLAEEDVQTRSRRLKSEGDMARPPTSGSATSRHSARSRGTTTLVINNESEIRMVEFQEHMEQPSLPTSAKSRISSRTITENNTEVLEKVTSIESGRRSSTPSSSCLSPTYCKSSEITPPKQTQTPRSRNSESEVYMPTPSSSVSRRSGDTHHLMTPPSEQNEFPHSRSYNSDWEIPHTETVVSRRSREGERYYKSTSSLSHQEHPKTRQVESEWDIPLSNNLFASRNSERIHKPVPFVVDENVTVQSGDGRSYWGLISPSCPSPVFRNRRQHYSSMQSLTDEQSSPRSRASDLDENNVLTSNSFTSRRRSPAGSTNDLQITGVITEVEENAKSCKIISNSVDHETSKTGSKSVASIRGDDISPRVLSSSMKSNCARSLGSINTVEDGFGQPSLSKNVVTPISEQADTRSSSRTSVGPNTACNWQVSNPTSQVQHCNSTLEESQQSYSHGSTAASVETSSWKTTKSYDPASGTAASCHAMSISAFCPEESDSHTGRPRSRAADPFPAGQGPVPEACDSQAAVAPPASLRGEGGEKPLQCLLPARAMRIFSLEDMATSSQLEIALLRPPGDPGGAGGGAAPTPVVAAAAAGGGGGGGGGGIGTGSSGSSSVGRAAVATARSLPPHDSKTGAAGAGGGGGARSRRSALLSSSGSHCTESSSSEEAGAAGAAGGGKACRRRHTRPCVGAGDAAAGAGAAAPAQPPPQPFRTPLASPPTSDVAASVSALPRGVPDGAAAAESATEVVFRRVRPGPGPSRRPPPSPLAPPLAGAGEPQEADAAKAPPGDAGPADAAAAAKPQDPFYPDVPVRTDAVICPATCPLSGEKFLRDKRHYALVGVEPRSASGARRRRVRSGECDTGQLGASQERLSSDDSARAERSDWDTAWLKEEERQTEALSKELEAKEESLAAQRRSSAHGEAEREVSASARSPALRRVRAVKSSKKPTAETRSPRRAVHRSSATASETHADRDAAAAAAGAPGPAAAAAGGDKLPTITLYRGTASSGSSSSFGLVSLRKMSTTTGESAVQAAGTSSSGRSSSGLRVSEWVAGTSRRRPSRTDSSRASRSSDLTSTPSPSRSAARATAGSSTSSTLTEGGGGGGRAGGRAGRRGRRRLLDSDEWDSSQLLGEEEEEEEEEEEGAARARRERGRLGAGVGAGVSASSTLVAAAGAVELLAARDGKSSDTSAPSLSGSRRSQAPPPPPPRRARRPGAGAGAGSRPSLGSSQGTARKCSSDPVSGASATPRPCDLAARLSLSRSRGDADEAADYFEAYRHRKMYDVVRMEKLYSGSSLTESASTVLAPVSECDQAALAHAGLPPFKELPQLPEIPSMMGLRLPLRPGSPLRPGEVLPYAGHLAAEQDAAARAAGDAAAAALSAARSRGRGRRVRSAKHRQGRFSRLRHCFAGMGEALHSVFSQCCD